MVRSLELKSPEQDWQEERARLYAAQAALIRERDGWKRIANKLHVKLRQSQLTAITTELAAMREDIAELRTRVLSVHQLVERRLPKRSKE